MPNVIRMWGGAYSCCRVSILAAVRQGGILSQILSAVYMDPLIKKLWRLGLGVVYLMNSLAVCCMQTISC